MVPATPCDRPAPVEQPAGSPTRARRHGSVAGCGPPRWPPPAAPRASQTDRRTVDVDEGTSHRACASCHHSHGGPHLKGGAGARGLHARSSPLPLDCVTVPPRLSWEAAGSLGPYPFMGVSGIFYTRSHDVYLMRVIRAPGSRRDMDSQGCRQYHIAPRTAGMVPPPVLGSCQQRSRKAATMACPCGFSEVGARGFEPPTSRTRTVELIY